MATGCSVPGCADKHRAKGMCQYHYMRSINGSVGRKRRWGVDDETHFWSLVDKTDSCWNWVGKSFSNGYGSLKVRDPNSLTGFKTMLAHRFSLALTGVDIEGHMVLHSCDNRACVRPSHLRTGNVVDNARDAVERDRMRSKLTKDQVVQVRECAANGMTYAQIAEKFGIHWAHVGRIVRRERRSDVE